MVLAAELGDEMIETSPTATSGLFARAALLSELLAAPASAENLTLLRAETFPAQWARNTVEAARGLGLITESGAAHESVERVAADYKRLFVGPGRRIVALASAYAPHLQAADLEAVYAELGFQPIPALPAHHLANELAFFARLTVLSPAPEQLLTTFAREHLRPWAGECLAEISLRAATLFYQGVGAIGMDFIESLPTR